MAPADGYRPGFGQGAVRSTTLDAVHRKRTDERVYRLVREDWGDIPWSGGPGEPAGQTWQVGRVGGEYRAIAIDQDSEAADVLIYPRGKIGAEKAIVVSNRSPWIGYTEGPILCTVKDGFPTGFGPRHLLKLNLYPHEPGWLPDKRADRRYLDFEDDFQNETEQTLLEEWFRGREGLTVQFDVSAITGEHDYHVYAGLSNASRGIRYDEIGTGTLDATGVVLTHWEGRADAIKVTLETTVGGIVDLYTTMHFRDEF